MGAGTAAAGGRPGTAAGSTTVLRSAAAAGAAGAAGAGAGAAGAGAAGLAAAGCGAAAGRVPRVRALGGGAAGATGGAGSPSDSLSRRVSALASPRVVPGRPSGCSRRPASATVAMRRPLSARMLWASRSSGSRCTASWAAAMAPPCSPARTWSSASCSQGCLLVGWSRAACSHRLRAWPGTPSARATSAWRSCSASGSGALGWAGGDAQAPSSDTTANRPAARAPGEAGGGVLNMRATSGAAVRDRCRAL
ncbi:hypothetical protein CKO37_08510 [Rubrivivax gelatinosus]|nr:hypothetical protein [Rubrivivax gelatinosus]